MTHQQKVLVIGGCGRIGNSVAQDIARHTDAEVTITSRQDRQQVDSDLAGRASDLKFLILDLANKERVINAIASTDLVVHCAGPFHHRDGRVLEACIEAGVNYVDVSDHRSFYERVIKHQEKAIANNVTAILNTGIFPGISNSMVKQGVEKFDRLEKIHLSYVVAGSGGAGLTVMRTTF